MGTRIFYFFCESCGGDTASYEPHSSCPYCHANGRQFELIAEIEKEDAKERVLQDVALRRNRWISEHPHVVGGRKQAFRLLRRR